MKDHLIQTGNYRCAFSLGDPKVDKLMGVISSFDVKTGITGALSTLDEHGVGLVNALVQERHNRNVKLKKVEELDAMARGVEAFIEYLHADITSMEAQEFADKLRKGMVR
ncbi:hypothetical protein M8R49_09705 [Enterobacter hormaechei]|uniref:hypothetical protein n=1 Tax=unclassified Enterobacter cloacae complex TaxID=2757714 RepID=UPI0006525A2D|nr:hypothetical protein [Enterobacter sp. BIDMC87]EHF4963694.1 hypothetical protein [Enterobacter hormaechei]EHF4979425.1 hypothetical protein [Enterobacter hormaechei]EHF4988758.1 hypothetical protein [Enterobacter hormaechei]EKY1421695.1 hypothetical protein [Enterobacter hormaechei]KLW58515.1 hypothetical protein SK57_04671 [Enterobacter sp. BIDMC87]